jgi:hypothetical protein
MSASIPSTQDDQTVIKAQPLETRQGKETAQQERSPLPYRHRELEWLRTHKETLRELAGQWVVVEGETIIAHGDNPLHVVADARAKGIQIPYIIHLVVTKDDEVMIGL